jgi:hypothetical protein
MWNRSRDGSSELWMETRHGEWEKAREDGWAKLDLKCAEGQAKAIGDLRTTAGSRWASKMADN